MILASMHGRIYIHTQTIKFVLGASSLPKQHASERAMADNIAIRVASGMTCLPGTNLLFQRAMTIFFSCLANKQQISTSSEQKVRDSRRVFISHILCIFR